MESPLRGYTFAGNQQFVVNSDRNFNRLQFSEAGRCIHAVNRVPRRISEQLVVEATTLTRAVFINCWHPLFKS
jgi:hypothetical protein